MKQGKIFPQKVISLGKEVFQSQSPFLHSCLGIERLPFPTSQLWVNQKKDYLCVPNLITWTAWSKTFSQASSGRANWIQNIRWPLSQQRNRELNPTTTRNWIWPTSWMSLEENSFPDKSPACWHLNFSFVSSIGVKLAKPRLLIYRSMR